MGGWAAGLMGSVCVEIQGECVWSPCDATIECYQVGVEAFGGVGGVGGGGDDETVAWVEVGSA